MAAQLSRMSCCPAVRRLMRATRSLLRRPSMTSAALLLFVCSMVASTSARLKCNRLDANSHTQRHPYSDSDTHADSNSDSNPHTYGGSDAEIHSNTEASSNAKASPDAVARIER